jgi:hypothetical protein
MMQSPLFTGGLAKLSKEEQAAKDSEEAEAEGEAKKHETIPNGSHETQKTTVTNGVEEVKAAATI